LQDYELKSSSERIGQLYPILVSANGEIIDGNHRFKAKRDWKRVKLNHIKSEKDILVARLISNTVRRNVTAKEKAETLSRLGEIYLNEGKEVGKLVYELAHQTGMSYRWVAKYLPDRFKDPMQSNRRKSSVAQHATESLVYEEPPEGALEVKTYRNTDFVSIVLCKSFFVKLDKKAEKLHITISALFYNAIKQFLNDH